MSDIIEIIEQLKAKAQKKFNETIELAINTNIDGKKTDQSIKGAIRLPHDIGIKRIIVAITDEKNVNADISGLDNVIQDIKENKIKMDRCVTTIDKMPLLRPISSILGKKGLMPNKKFNLIMDDIHKAVEHAKYDIHYRSEKNGIVHLVIGKLNMPSNEIKENIEYVIHHISKLSFNDISITKVQNKITSAYLSTTQGKTSTNITNFIQI